MKYARVSHCRPGCRFMEIGPVRWPQEYISSARDPRGTERINPFSGHHNSSDSGKKESLIRAVYIRASSVKSIIYLYVSRSRPTFVVFYNNMFFSTYYKCVHFRRSIQRRAALHPQKDTTTTDEACDKITY